VKRCLLLPDIIQIICNVWHAMGARSVNWELSIESLCGLATLKSLFALQSQIKWWSFKGTVISHSVVETEGALDILGLGNSSGNRIDCTPNIILFANAS